MLPKINRLKSDKDFKNVFKNGKTLENRFFRVKIMKNGRDDSRFGFVIGVKILKEAVLRNKLKRRLRSASRFLVNNLKTRCDIVVWPKRASTSLSYKDLSEYLNELITKNDPISL